MAIDKLIEESKKLVDSSAKSLIKVPYQLSPQLESLCNTFLSHLLKPKDWMDTTIKRKFLIKSDYIIDLAHECQSILEKQSTILKLKMPIKIFGDLHGQFSDLMRFFDLWRGPMDPSLKIGRAHV